MSITSDIRRLQRRARGGAISFSFDESGAEVTARIFPTRGEAADIVTENLKEEGRTRISINRFNRFVEDELKDPLFTATGSTMEEAMHGLGKAIAEGDRANAEPSGA
jgi:hypothetical protein